MNNNNLLYQYSKSPKKQAIVYINMGVMCWVYVLGFYLYQIKHSPSTPESLSTIFYTVFPLASLILFLIARYHFKHPGVYSATITKDYFTVIYPDSKQWSFKVKTPEIKRFEHRQTLSHAGKGIGKSGVLLKDGSFHEICLNYGPNMNKMYRAVKSIYPEVMFPKTVNKKVSGFLEKDYDN